MSIPPKLLNAVAKHLGYEFSNRQLLELALTDANTAQQSNLQADNERLELLGDAVLGLAISALLYKLFPSEDEGSLAKRRSALVCQKQLSAIAAECEVSEAMEGQGMAPNASLLENAMEALLGAVFLDGGYQPAEQVVARLWQEVMLDMQEPPQDAKSALQEWSQAHGLGLPEYKLIEQDGPAHAPHFTMQVQLTSGLSAIAEGSSKREAAKQAAALLLAKVVI